MVNTQQLTRRALLRRALTAAPALPFIPSILATAWSTDRPPDHLELNKGDTLPMFPTGGRVSDIRPVAASPAPSYQIENPYAVPGLFRKAQFHLHTTESFDGQHAFTPEATAIAFKQAGYAFLMFTDHDVATDFSRLNDDTFVAVGGYESTGASGHIGGWFTSALVNKRMPAQQRIDEIRDAGGVAVLNHPSWSTGYDVERLKDLNGFQCLEIYNHLTATRDGERLQDNLRKWHQILNRGGSRQPVSAIAVSDAHNGSTSGGWTVVKSAEVSSAALREAIVRGSIYATNGPEFREIEVIEDNIVVSAVTEPQSPAGVERIRFIDHEGQTVHEEAAARATFRPTGRERWVRVEAIDPQGRTAWSQPLWITAG